MYGQTLKDCFTESCLVHGEKIAISFLREGTIETEISYKNLDRDANRMANTFLDLGVEKGDRVILFLQKSVGFVVAHLALQKIGVIAVPFNPEFKKSEITYLLENAEAKLVLSGTEQEATIKEIAPGLTNIVVQTERPYQDLDFFRSASDSVPPVDVGPEDPGLIIYTSGTTGKPKGAVLNQGNLVHDAKNIVKIWEITEADVFCHSLPLFHVHGLNYALHTTLMAGAHVIMLDKFSPEKVMEVLSRRAGEYVCNMFMAVPSMYGKIINYLGEKKLNFEHMRLWTSGSAPLSVKDFEKIKVMFGNEPVEREGMSETGMNFSNQIRGMRKPGSIGVPLPDLEVRIVDPDTFVDVTPGETGEFWLKGPSITEGYWRKPEVTAGSFEKGWFKTGDLGRVDEDGYYYLTDRLKHIIISGGENVSPKEVEVVINQLGDVVDSSVVGIPDEKWGEKVVAAVVTKPGSKVEAEDIQRFCREHIHKWKCPKEIVFLKELPKNTMGKVLKEEVKKLFSTEEPEKLGPDDKCGWGL
ncbi:MAG: class I adenylate-forming enzyme family protein [Syntrophales bacterium]|nr:class I adenylate-forming enzyme family protein [Syntrophales bacterium]